MPELKSPDMRVESEKSLPPQTPGNKAAPRYPFFMSLRDLGFWAQSARADAMLARLEREHGTEKAFDLLYSKLSDPWGFNVAGYRYQRLKYEKMLAMLPVRPYASALDIGCGLGLLTRRLASRADSVLGVELSSVGVENARQLSGDYANITYRQGDVRDLPHSLDRQFDLIVLADVLYYLTPTSDAILKSVAEGVGGLLKPGGVLLLANHYFSNLDTQSRHVSQMHACFRWAEGLERVSEQRHPFFLATVLQKSAAHTPELAQADSGHK